jgi:hypothetical protein
MIFDKHRFEIWTQAQHPYKHTLSDFGYSNPAVPGVSDINSAFNWIFKVLYPTAKPAVNTTAALPTIGNVLNDYRVVLDDGDGNQAGYRWEQREGEVVASWHKVFDFDWSTDSILAAFQDITQDLYIYQKGKSDLDPSGNVITGLYAGQNVYGGNLANQNLTLYANSGDGVGPHTGFVQVDDTFRPTVHNTYNLGTATNSWRDAYVRGSVFINTLTLTSGSITDSSGTINFGSTILTTTGNITGAIVTGSTSLKTGTMTITGGSIADTSGAISFGSANLSTTGTIVAASGSQLADFTFTTGSLVSASPTISFGANNLSTTGTLGAGNATLTRMDSDNVRVDGNTISILNSNGSLILQANGTGIVDIQNAMTTLDQTVTGTLSVTGQLNADNLRLDANTISSTNLNGNIILSPNGSGLIQVGSSILPSSGVIDLGAIASLFQNLYLSGGISDGTTSISQATLQSLRGINTGVTAGMTIFWSGSAWVPSLPDTEIDHTTIGNLTLGDSGHTQFVMLSGRAGGQIIQGGTATSEHLTLESTSNATKGKVKTKDSFVAFTAPTYSGGWTGTDLGAVSAEFNNIYTKGELVGGRLQNVLSTSLPSASGQNVGRVAWATDVNKIYVDMGGTWKVIGAGKYVSDTSWNGVQTTQTFTVSASIDDARNSLWAIHDNANDFEQIFCTIKAISATQVSVTVSPALPAGSYRLIGIE